MSSDSDGICTILCCGSLIVIFGYQFLSENWNAVSDAIGPILYGIVILGMLVGIMYEISQFNKPVVTSESSQKSKEQISDSTSDASESFSRPSGSEDKFGIEKMP